MSLTAFDEFVARKTLEASTRTLAPYVTVADEHDDRFVSIGSDWSRAIFDGDFYLSPASRPELPATSLVFVQSRDGNTGARDPSALGGGETDKHLVYEGLSRVAADAVLAGAETVRGGRTIFSVWQSDLVALRAALGKPRHPIQVVASLAGIDVTNGLLFNVPAVPVVLLTVQAVANAMSREIRDRPWIQVVIMRGPQDLAGAFTALRQQGIGRLSVVGGRSLASQLIGAGLIQDIFLTTSPIEGGEPNTPLYPRVLDARLVVRKRGTGPEVGVVFDHVAVGFGL